MTVNQERREEGFADAWSSKDNDDMFFYCDHSDARTCSTTTTGTCTLRPSDPVAAAAAGGGGGGLVCGLSSQFDALVGGPHESFSTTSTGLYQDQLSLQEGEQKWRALINTKVDQEHNICNPNGETRRELLQVNEDEASMQQCKEVFYHLLQQPNSSSPTAVEDLDFSLFSSHNSASQVWGSNHHCDSSKQHQHEESRLFHESSMLTPASNEALEPHNGLLPTSLSEPFLSTSLVPSLLQGEEQSHESSYQTSSPPPPPPPGFSSFIVYFI